MVFLLQKKLLCQINYKDDLLTDTTFTAKQRKLQLVALIFPGTKQLAKLTKPVSDLFILQKEGLKSIILSISNVQIMGVVA